MLCRFVRTTAKTNPAKAKEMSRANDGVELLLGPSLVVLEVGGVPLAGEATGEAAGEVAALDEGDGEAAALDEGDGEAAALDEGDGEAAALDEGDGEAAALDEGDGKAATALLAMLAEQLVLPPPPRPEPLH
jgi:hypothetical protein